MLLVALAGFSTKLFPNKIMIIVGGILCQFGLMLVYMGISGVIKMFDRLSSGVGEKPETFSVLIGDSTHQTMYGWFIISIATLVLSVAVLVTAKSDIDKPIIAIRKVLSPIALILGVIAVGLGVISIIAYQNMITNPSLKPSDLARDISAFMMSNASMTLAMFFSTTLTIVCLLILPSKISPTHEL